MIPFIFPYTHDQGTVRRWPVVTLVLIGACLVVHALAFPAIERQERERRSLEAEIARLKAEMYVKHGLAGAGAMADLMDRLGPRNLMDLAAAMGAQMDAFWREFTQGGVVSREHEDYRRWDGLRRAQEETERSSLARRFGFVPAARTAHAYFTASFLHGGLLHLLVNLFFLYLIGPTMEDRWGRGFFLAFYLAGGAAALEVQSRFAPDPTIPVIGASGAVAAVMGAFMVRFARARVRFWWFIWLLRVRTGTFDLPAWAVLGFWALLQLASAAVLGGILPVAYAAHVGGFAFGAAVALVVAATGLEKHLLAPLVDRALVRPAYRSDPRLVRAHGLLAEGKAAEALPPLQALLGERPGDLTVKRELLRALLALGRLPEARAEGRDLVDRLAAEGNVEEAAAVYAEVAAASPDFSAGAEAQLAVARHLERRGDLSAAAAYRSLAERWHDFALAPKALSLAARFTWERLGDPQGAFRLYRRLLERYPESPLAEHARTQLVRISGGQVVFQDGSGTGSTTGGSS